MLGAKFCTFRSLMNRLDKAGSAIFILLFWFGCFRGIDFFPDFLCLCLFLLKSVELTKHTFYVGKVSAMYEVDLYTVPHNI